jgi:hypothetical protein
LYVSLYMGNSCDNAIILKKSTASR